MPKLEKPNCKKPSREVTETQEEWSSSLQGQGKTTPVRGVLLEKSIKVEH